MPCRPSACRRSTVGWARMKASVNGSSAGRVEIVGQDGGDARGGEGADRDGPGGGRFRPGGVEPAVEPPHTQAGAKTLLGMGAAGEHRQDEPLRVGPDRASPALEALWGPLGIA